MGRTLEDAFGKFHLTDAELDEFAEAVRQHFEEAYRQDFPEAEPDNDN